MDTHFPLLRLFPILSVVAFAAGLDFNTIPRPPLPPDPLELVTGDAQPVQDAQQRIAAREMQDVFPYAEALRFCNMFGRR